MGNSAQERASFSDTGLTHIRRARHWHVLALSAPIRAIDCARVGRLLESEKIAQDSRGVAPVSEKTKRDWGGGRLERNAHGGHINR